MNFHRFINQGRALLPPILIALLVFEIVVGHERLLPTNIAWLTRTGWSDGWGAYLGWETYRYSPWTLPIGSNLAYGMDIGNSLIYTDSIPLLAIPFKLISSLLPVPFQYFGFWILLCFCLQATITWKIFSRYTSNKLMLTCATLIFLFSPILLKRLNVHMSQVGQFLFLWALYLIIQTQAKKIFRWFILLLISALVHPYFLVLNASIFIANEFYLRNIFQYSYLNVLKNILSVTTSLLPALWLAGYFVSLEGSTNPFYNNLFKMDLIQPINFTGWSLLFAKQFPYQQGNLEGFNYLGPGTLILALFCLSVAIFTWIFKDSLVKLRKELFPLVVVLVFFTLYAITYEVTFARHELFTLPLPQEIKNSLTSFRASGRFFAPVFYFFTFFVLKTVIRVPRKKFVSAILLLATLLQVIDTRPGWGPIKTINQPSNILSLGDTNLQSWSLILSDKKIILSIPSKIPSELCQEWRLVGYLAYKFKLHTNCFYFARSSGQNRLINRKSTIRLLEQGDPAEGVVLVLSPKEFAQYFQPMLSNKWDITQIGNLFVLTSPKR